MNYSQIRKMDISNGPGIRVSLFTQGCSIHCPGCFNKSIWSYDGGQKWTSEIESQFLSLCSPSYISGISILGGEPLSFQNFEELKKLFKSFRKLYPEKTIWMWTGYEFEMLNKEQLEVVKLVDVLVDGPWVKKLADLSLKFKGSSNQRIINVKKTLKENKVIIVE